MSSLPSRGPLLPALLPAGLLAGVLDGSSAVVNHWVHGGHTPERIFNFIASGIVGPDAMTGGTPMVLLGILLHMLIAMTWTALIFVAAARVAWIRQHSVMAALPVGLTVWLVMNLVVLPLSRVSTRPTTITSNVTGALILVVFIALPSTLLARRYYGTATV
jgi:hypothetical protein